jgi:hypothetical protein
MYNVVVMSKIIIPKTLTHERANRHGYNNKEYCKCIDCSNLRKRRDSGFFKTTFVKFLLILAFIFNGEYWK